ncbi:MAG: PEP-CTERM sorting domain-containing protein [Candidatus Omnitrophica bacterium]|nr:PEP-CTERM sorting domain-containing protein [Candidatus Omnitrophota bacterium]MDE2222726.1 PEP-CTERM sorting domain-containing protein [Candidatus Omnitrophota bacterium]
MMNFSKIILVVFMLLAGLSTARAQSVTLYQNIYSYKDGGEFTAKTNPNDFMSAYAPEATLNGGFETFCVESNVYFYPGHTYSYVLTDMASTGQKLSLGAAYLYDKFATGTLTGYNYTDTPTRKSDNGELQSALWEFQGHQTVAGFPSYSTDPFYNLAINDLGGTAAAFSPNNGTYGVDIIQLYGANGAPAQAQLVLTPAPEPSTWLLLAMGLLMVVGVKVLPKLS